MKFFLKISSLLAAMAMVVSAASADVNVEPAQNKLLCGPRLQILRGITEENGELALRGNAESGGLLEVFTFSKRGKWAMFITKIVESEGSQRVVMCFVTEGTGLITIARNTLEATD